MQIALFVFAGLTGKNSNASLTVLKERLEKRFSEIGISNQFIIKEQLLSSRFDEVSFYVSFLNNKDELKDWFQMAKDAELKFEKTPIDKVGLIKRYSKLEKSPFYVYKKIHFSLGLIIIEEMEKFTDVTIYAFQ